MPTTLSKIQIINTALARIGVKPISDLDATDDVPAETARNVWPVAFDDVARSHSWSCLTQPAVLQAEAQTPINPVPPDPVPASTPWAPSTLYTVNTYVTYGDPAYLYQCLYTHTSSASFTNDLTQGKWFQTDITDPNSFPAGCAGSNYPSGWAYKYPLPSDCLLVVAINDTPCQGHLDEYEILVDALYTNEDQAVIKYVAALEDTTRYDAMFVRTLVYKLAADMATVLRQDDTDIAFGMERLYIKALSAARTKDAGERRPRQYSPVANSRWIGSRWRSTNS